MHNKATERCGEERAPYYRIYLQAELARRCQRNPRYSLRAFAAHLALDPGAFSRILSGKRPLSVKLAGRLAQSLALGPEESTRFLSSVAEDRAWQGLRQVMAPPPKETAPTYLPIDLFQAISDLSHYAIMELTYVEGFQSDPRWIARQLGITAIEAQLAIARLLRLGLLERKEGRLSKSQRLLTTQDKHVSTPALRTHQKQVLQRAAESLERDPIEERSHTSMTMAVDPDKLPLARTLIEEFTQSLCRTLETGRQRRVYQMGVSLFPLQKKSKEKPRV